jgi:hypothetical protein
MTQRSITNVVETRPRQKRKIRECVGDCDQDFADRLDWTLHIKKILEIPDSDI